MMPWYWSALQPSQSSDVVGGSSACSERPTGHEAPQFQRTLASTIARVWRRFAHVPPQYRTVHSHMDGVLAFVVVRTPSKVVMLSVGLEKPHRRGV